MIEVMLTGKYISFNFLHHDKCNKTVLYEVEHIKIINICKVHLKTLSQRFPCGLRSFSILANEINLIQITEICPGDLVLT